MNRNITSPFKHLQSYTKEDGLQFFGRDHEIKSVSKQLNRTQFFIFYGPTGSGKTSLFNAGVCWVNRIQQSAIIKFRFNNLNEPFEAIFEQLDRKWNCTKLNRKVSLGPDEIDRDVTLGSFIKNYFDLEYQLFSIEEKMSEIKLKLAQKENEDDILEYKQLEKEKKRLYIEKEPWKNLDTSFNSLYKLNKELPIFLFDQFEEIFIYRKDDQDFIQKVGLFLRLLIKNDFPLRVILIVRSEYLGDLYHFEKYIPKIFAPKILLEPPNKKSLTKIMSGLFEEYKISIEFDELKTIILGNIIDDVHYKGHNSFPLPFLQIYLDYLYSYVYYKNNTQPFDVNHLKPITITSNDVREVGSMQEVLNKILSRANIEILELSTQSNFPKFILESKTPASLLLKELVSDAVTKRRFYYKRSEDGIIYEERDLFLERLNSKNSKLSEQSQNSALEELFLVLEKNNLITNNQEEQYIELAHDSLASLVQDIVIEDDEYKLWAQKFLSDFAFYKKSKNRFKHQNYLSRAFLNNIESESKLKAILESIGIKENKPQIIHEEQIEYWRKSKNYRRNLEWTKIATIALSFLFLFFSIAYLNNKTYESEISEENAVLEKEKNALNQKIFQDLGKAFQFAEVDRTLAQKYKDSLPSNLHKLLEENPESDGFWTYLLNQSKDRFDDLVKRALNSKEHLTKLKEEEKKRDSIEFIKNIQKAEDFVMKDGKDYTLRQQYFNKLFNERLKYPFYEAQFAIETPNQIVAIKSRVGRNPNDILHVFAQTRNSIYKYEFDLEQFIVISMDSVDFGNGMSINAFEPFFSSDGSIHMLVSYDDLLVVYDEQLHHTITHDLDKEIIYIEKLDNGEFLCLDTDRKTIYSLNLSGNQLIRPKNIDFSSSISYISSFEIKEILKIPESSNFFIKARDSILEKVIKIVNDKTELWMVDSYLGGVKDIIVQKDGSFYYSDSRVVYKVSKPPAVNPVLVYDNDLNGEIRTVDIFEELLVIGSEGNTAQTFIKGRDPSKSYKKQELIGHNESIENVTLFKVDAEGKKYCLTADEDGKVKIWKVSDSSIKTVNLSSSSVMDIDEIVFSDSSVLVSFGRLNNKQNRIVEFDIDLNPKQNYYYRGLPNVSKEISHFSLYQKDLVVSVNKTLVNAQIAGSKNRSLVITHQDEILHLATDGDILASVSLHDLYIYDLSSNTTHVDSQIEIPIDDYEIECVAIHTGKNLIALGTRTGPVLIGLIDGHKGFEILEYHQDNSTVVKFSPDGNFLVSGSDDNRVVVWSTDDFARIKVLKVHHNDIEDIDISMSNVIASASKDRTVQLHKIIDNSEIVQIPSPITHEFSIQAVAFSDNDSTIYTGDKQGMLKKWNTNKF